MYSSAKIYRYSYVCALLRTVGEIEFLNLRDYSPQTPLHSCMLHFYRIYIAFILHLYLYCIGCERYRNPRWILRVRAFEIVMLKKKEEEKKRKRKEISDWDQQLHESKQELEYLRIPANVSISSCRSKFSSAVICTNSLSLFNYFRFYIHCVYIVRYDECT